MARPKKQTVDYFPHYCNHSKTLEIVEAKYGNDGYAFWFKMLQILGRTEGHVFDYNGNGNWLYLLTETHVTESTAEKILETLAGVGSIDKELWQKKIIWSQHFVDNVADVYKRRMVDVPQRPGSPIPKVVPVLIQGDKVAGMISYYEDELGKTLTPTDYEKLKDFADQYPDGWFEKAVDEVKSSPKAIRSPVSYIGTIMERRLKEEQPPETSGDNQGIKTI